MQTREFVELASSTAEIGGVVLIVGGLLIASARYVLARHWSLDLEYRYQHISNANLAGHNLGINAHGPVLGISYFF